MRRLRSSPLHRLRPAPTQVVYQIFPDRFANGDPSIGVRQGEVRM